MSQGARRPDGSAPPVHATAICRCVGAPSRCRAPQSRQGIPAIPELTPLLGIGLELFLESRKLGKWGVRVGRLVAAFLRGAVVLGKGGALGGIGAVAVVAARSVRLVGTRLAAAAPWRPLGARTAMG